jgi:hypothetical protein
MNGDTKWVEDVVEGEVAGAEEGAAEVEGGR